VRRCDRLAVEETGPVEELIGREDDADLAVLVEKVSSSLTDRQRDVFALYGAGTSARRSQTGSVCPSAMSRSSFVSSWIPADLDLAKTALERTPQCPAESAGRAHNRTVRV
jgi:hypothetical protein